MSCDGRCWRTAACQPDLALFRTLCQLTLQISRGIIRLDAPSDETPVRGAADPGARGLVVWLLLVRPSQTSDPKPLGTRRARVAQHAKLRARWRDREFQVERYERPHWTDAIDQASERREEVKLDR